MRLYGKRFVKQRVNELIGRKKELYEGVLWSVDTTTQTCRVKIQGSNTQIVAHYPRNLDEIPSWLRAGNSVRLAYRSGIRGYIEVAGPGRAIPTPVSGSALPDTSGLSDGIVSGLIVTAVDPPVDGVLVSAGTYRIDGTVYSSVGYTGSYIVMDDPAPMVMGQTPYVPMGTQYLLASAAPASGLFRYDAYVIGTNGVIDYITGVEVASNPAKPSVPASHVLLAYILRVGGDTSITTERIYATWTTPVPTGLTVTAVDEFPWDEEDDFPETDVKVDITNQYGTAISNATGWTMKLTMIVGTGQVWSGDTGYNATEVSQSLVGVSTYTFKYQRNQTVTEINPYLQVTLESPTNIFTFLIITLLT
jgi:hypothetical protein